MNKVLVETSVNDALDALADVQRRSLLVALLTYNPQDDAPPITADSGNEGDAVERLVRMKHVHLPKLEEYGFIHWDEDTHEVSNGPNFDEISPLLELMDDNKDELPLGWL